MAADILINLAGKSVDCRYTEKNKSLILSSRIDATRVLGLALKQCENPPKIWLNSSTATIYRHSLDQQMEEVNGEIGQGFSVDVATTWEQEFFKHELLKTRQVSLRTSIVLGQNGGAFPPIKRLAYAGLGGKQGDGQQWVSWIHEKDFARSIEHIINDPTLIGPINLVSPTPIRNKDLMQKTRFHLRMPFGIPLPKKMLQLGAKFIGTETELILKSRNVIPGKLLKHNFTFYYPNLDRALINLLS